MGDEHLDTIPATESDEVIKSSVEDLVPIPSESEGFPDTMCDVHLVNNPTPLEAKDHFEIALNSNDDISSSDDNSLYKENIEYVEASPHDSELFSLEVAEIVISEEEEIEGDNLHEKLLNVHLLIANIEALKDNPTQSSEFLTNIIRPCGIRFYLVRVCVFGYSALVFRVWYIRDLKLTDFTHEVFTDELAHIISPPEYDCFYFRNLPDPGECISILNSGIRENLSSTTHVNLPVEDDHSPLLAYVVWIFLAYLTYLVNPPYLYSFGNEDTIFDPGIAIYLFYSFNPGLSHRCETFKKFNTHRSHLNENLMEILLHLAGSQPMLKSSYKAKASVIISIPPLVGGVADVVVEIKGTGGSSFFWQWEHLPLAVGNYTTSGNSLLAVGMPCAFYSQHVYYSYSVKCKLLAVGSSFFWQWEHPPLAVGNYTASGNTLLAVRIPCAFYSQQSSPKLDAPSALKFSRIK
nr:hypothetical protein [Tanacetum cinerariifolium]